MGPTEAFATFAVEMDGKTLPPAVVHAARRAILDTLGVALAGSLDPSARIVAAHARARGSGRESSLWGCGGLVGAQEAALANGTAAHALDFDDTNDSICGHPSVPVLPAAMAVGERLGATGRDVLAAFVVGFEVECKLGGLTGGEMYDRGWHNTTTLGVVGATAAVARLMGLDVPQMRRALGLAVSQASGVRQNFGTMTKPFHVGRAAQSAVLAAELVAQGFTASEVAIEGEAGFWDVFGGPTDRDRGSLLQSLGQPFEIVTPGVNVKAYPCCAFTHAPIDAARQASGGLEAEAIESVVAEIPYTGSTVLIHHRPATPLAAKFSLEYTAAAALLDGTVRLSHFTEAAVARPDLQSLLRRVATRVPEEWQKGVPLTPMRHARVEVRLKDGTVRRGQADAPTGSAANPMSDADLERKFLNCASMALGERRAREVLDLLRAFDRLGDVRGLTAKLTNEQPAISNQPSAVSNQQSAVSDQR